MKLITDALQDSFFDTMKILPFLFLAYLFIEYVEHKADEKIYAPLYNLGRKGPVLGSVIGLLPMCGIAATAADLFSTKLISAGTLIAVLTAQSDEALAVLIGTDGFRLKALELIAVKLVIGIVSGFAADAMFPVRIDHNASHQQHELLHSHCEEDECEKEGIFMTAVIHALKSFLFVFVTVFLLNILVSCVGEDSVAQLFSLGEGMGPLLAALLGLIPNCAPSIILTQFYIEGAISFGSLAAGLTINSGVGLAMLWSANRDRKQNLKFTVFLFLISVMFGFLIQAAGLN